MKQEKRRVQTITLLIETTKQLIEQKSCHLITLQDIMNGSGLSKGAIFHYIKSKDELFVWVLRERLEETNERFMNEINEGRQTFEQPMQQIKETIDRYEKANDVTNKVLMYLLARTDDPLIAEALKQYFERAVTLSKMWIEMGQRHGVIKDSIEVDTTAELFVLLTFGLRVRSSIPNAAANFKAQHLTALISNMLRSHK